jgi:hypothetical protein
MCKCSACPWCAKSTPISTSGRSHHAVLTTLSLFPLCACAQPRCPQFDAYVTGNDGKSFQAGCGYDPIDTGKCGAEVVSIVHALAITEVLTA